MKRQTFEITIFKFKEVLHKAKYDFNNLSEASNFALGVFKGLEISGKAPTGTEIKPINKKGLK